MKIPTIAFALTFASATLAVAALAAAQEPAKPEQAPPKQDEPEKAPLNLPPLPGMDPEEGMKKELLELFAKVEGRLRAIDTQMNEAAAGRVPLQPVVGSGIEELLRAGQAAKKPESVGELLASAAQDSQQTQEDIRRMLQIAQQLNKKSSSSSSSSSGSGSSKPGSQPGNSPLDKKGGSEPSGREQTPKAPGSKPEENGKPGGNEPQDSPKKDPDGRGENRDGPRPPAQKTGPASAADGADRWGDLPVRAREIFRVEGASDLPPQYRDWIDGYYRRLQSLERP
ncbi:MAG TPA: hypothetical protein VM509_14630 [Planctomycetota bacterium]|nr:hypothetical protein [Planctomycetota bacterium]